jgi:hypothetical protein
MLLQAFLTKHFKYNKRNAKTKKRTPALCSKTPQLFPNRKECKEKTNFAIDTTKGEQINSQLSHESGCIPIEVNKIFKIM